MTNVPEPARVLSDAAEQVRAFNHASMSAAENWEFPSHSYDALGSLSYLAGMLPQAISQATRPVMRTYEHGRIRIDNGGDADVKVAELVKAREDAVRAAAALTSAVQRMHNATSPMGFDTSGLPEFEDDDQADDEPASCGRCKKPFNPADTRFDGHAQHKLTPYCRRCVDNCGDGGTEHVCVICDPKRYGGEGQ